MDIETEKAAAPVLTEQEAEPVSRLEFSEILEHHRAWLASSGETGRQADFSRSHLEGADLTDVDLRQALLNRTILTSADLLLADLQGASLIQADLQFANLLDTKFRHANLQGANLEGATGLRSGQFAGANLFGAALPCDFTAAEGLQQATALARQAVWLIAAMLFLIGLTWLRIFTTSDVRLLQNASALPLARSQNLLPLVPFYLFGPVLILGLYGCFHLYLQRLWDCVAALPAIFPDGRHLDAALPWFARWPARTHFPSLASDTPALSRLETAIAMLGIYWTVPVTMLLFWGRYLTLQDLRGTALHIALVVAATAGALYFPRGVARAFTPGGGRARAPEHSAAARKQLLRRVAPLGEIGLLLFLLSAGIVWGGPRTSGTAWGPATWAAHVLSVAGYNPYGQLTESEVSTKPANWSGRDDDLAAIQGANLNNRSLRHMQAYGAFFVKAHLWQADLQQANLSEADLREANLRQADLRSAFLDRAKLNRAILHQADLQQADATQADLRECDLSHALLTGAVLTDARLDGASLYGADMRNVQLDRASFAKADLREANLNGASGTMANFQEAYLSSAKLEGASLERAQLLQTILTGADLRNADLRGAALQGAVLNGANLTGANLQGADLRGAVGVDAAQICSAVSLQGTQLDDAVEQAVQSQCASHR